jgi:hypothetical protein
MGMPELEDGLKSVRAHPNDTDFVGARDERLVAAGKAALGMAFPPTYRRFVLELGTGSVGGEEVYGVINEDFEHSSVPDAIWLTLKQRAQFRLPSAMIVMYGTGDGDYYLLDTSRADADGECPVVAWSPGFDAIASDFGAFFLATVQEALGLV